MTQLPGNKGETISVLHVDDDEMQLDQVKQFLKHFDSSIEINSETSPIDALNKLDSKNYDCIITDFSMPEMNGIDFARRVKQKHGIPIILYTGQGSEDVAEKAFSIGVNDYLRKENSPSHYQVLVKKIRQVVQAAEMERFFRSLVNLTPDGIATMNYLGQFTYVNPAFLKIVGHETDDITGKSITNVSTVRPQDVPRYLGILVQIMRGKIPPPFEFVFIKRDGSEGWGEAHLQLLKTTGGKRELLAFLKDITERKKTLLELERSSANLKEMVQERSDRLLEAENMIVSGKIAAQVGHDLRGPLNTIKNATYLLEKHPEKLKEMIAIINKSVDSSTALLDELRTKRKDAALNLGEVYLNDFVKTVTSEIVLPTNYNIEESLGAESSVSIDLLKMRRVLENLIRNAQEAMPSGGTIRISTDSNPEFSQITISDGGLGISPEIMKNLFQPFQTYKKNGTGLGLYYCKQIVEAHLGEIKMKSKVGSGTTCSIILPTKSIRKAVSLTVPLTPHVVKRKS